MDLAKDKTVRKIISRLSGAKAGTVVKAEGMWGSFGSLLTSHIFEELDRPILYVCPHIDDADRANDDLRTFGADEVETLGAWEGEEDLADATDEVRYERLRVLLKLLSWDNKSGALKARPQRKGNMVICTSIQALCQPVPKKSALEQGYLPVQVGRDYSVDQVVGWLVDNGFEHVEKIDLPGQFARRGGIIDIYAPVVSDKVLLEQGRSESRNEGGEAIRVEFFGDTVESIRQVDLDTQRSRQQIQSVNIVSVVCGTGREERSLFVEALPEEAVIVFEEINDIQEVAEIFVRRVGDENLYRWEDIYRAASRYRQLHLCRFAGGDEENYLRLNVGSIQRYEQKANSLWSGHKKALEELVACAETGTEVLLYCERAAEISRVREIIESDGNRIPPAFKLLVGFVNHGFTVNSLNAVVISHHELFGQYALRRRQRPGRTGVPVDSLSDLEVGDYVVHVSYGIGKFRGIHTIEEDKGKSEYLTIEYADGVRIHVSVNNIGLVQKYIGTSPARPRLSKVGSKKWQRQKEMVARSVEDLAGDLLQVQAQRKARGGISFGADSQWQVEFEESFAYQETADQITAIEQIKGDMQEPAAMDRLLCGDVGYGKTELAMRAAFKAVENNKQVAVLVPTTVLAVQHGRTFTERFADFPISIEVLNRFKTTSQAQDIIQRAREGKVDVLIGTHRLLSKDVGFKDLGLLVIDEEQRFGVEHKEKLKRLRVNVDVLTMTATPIPRTLHMSLLGLRDISSLQTPPLDRRSIVTKVMGSRRDVIKKSVLRELNRRGQVFFLHNRVKTIDNKAWEIRKLLEDTEAQVSVAHGQMPRHQLEQAMIDFVTGCTDVLVCTTIIESGLDIPNANTIFIDDADRFGLAELHQLRGRVGRYKHRAYAYMLIPKNRPVTPVGAKRLKAIEEYSHLGAGFRIALRDLEIRGAGNILGAEQSGHIQVVGYQMYCDLLAGAVKRLKNEPQEPTPSAVIDLGFSVYIPKNYVPHDKQRMELYRRIWGSRNETDLEQVADEMRDIYGPVPETVEFILTLAGLRIKASKYGIKSIVVSGDKLVFTFDREHRGSEEPVFAGMTDKVRRVQGKRVYIKLHRNYFEERTLLSVLRKMLGRGATVPA